MIIIGKQKGTGIKVMTKTVRDSKASVQSETKNQTSHKFVNRQTSNTQVIFCPQVVCRFLSLPEDYWRRVLAGNTEPTPSSNKKTLSHDEGLGPGV